MRAKSAAKFAGALLLGAIDVSGVSSIPLATLMAVAAIGCMAWATWGAFADINISRIGARRDSTTSQNFSLTAKVIIVSTVTGSFAFGLIGWYGAVLYRGKVDESMEMIHYIRSSQIRGNTFKITADTHRLSRFSSDYFIMLSCQKPNSTLDPLDIKGITNSAPFDIQNNVAIQVNLPSSVLDIRDMRPQTIRCFLSLVPNSLRGRDVDTLRHIKDAGGRVLESIGATILSPDATKPPMAMGNYLN